MISELSYLLVSFNNEQLKKIFFVRCAYINQLHCLISGKLITFYFLICLIFSANIFELKHTSIDIYKIINRPEGFE